MTKDSELHRWVGGEGEGEVIVGRYQRWGKRVDGEINNREGRGGLKRKRGTWLRREEGHGRRGGGTKFALRRQGGGVEGQLLGDKKTRLLTVKRIQLVYTVQCTAHS